MKLRYLQMLDALGVTPTPAQREVCRVAFDGEEPDRETLGERIWGARGLEPTSSPARVFGAVCGRGSGKTRFFGAYRLLHLALTVDLSLLSPGEDASCPIVAPDLKTACHTLNFARAAALLLCPSAILESTTERFVIRRDHGKRVAIEAKAASTGGRSIRGRSMPGALLEECAFFYDQDHRINDAEIYRALQPRIMSGGQLLAISSPWSKSGVLWDLYHDNYGHPHGALIAHAPTLLMREGGPEYDDILQAVEAMRRTDPENARREYDAEFLSTNASAYFDQRAIEAAIDPTLELPCTAEFGEAVHFAGDFGFTRDSAALVGVGRTETYRCIELIELRPTDGALKPSKTVERFAQSIHAAGCDVMAADGHYRESIREHLDTEHIDLVHAPEGVQGKAETHAVARSLLHSHVVRIPQHDRLIRQMQQLEARATSGGQLSFSSPRWATGGHGDIVSAWVLAMWRAYKLGWTKPEAKTSRQLTAEQHIERVLARQKARHDAEYDYGD